MSKKEKRVSIKITGKANRNTNRGTFKAVYRNMSKKQLEDAFVAMYTARMPESEIVTEDTFREMADAVFEERVRLEDTYRGKQEVDRFPYRVKERLYDQTSIDLDTSYSLFKDTVLNMIANNDNFNTCFMSSKAIDNIKILPTIQLIALKEMFKASHKNDDPNSKGIYNAEEDYLKHINLTLASRGFLREDSYDGMVISNEYLADMEAIKNAEPPTEADIARFRICSKIEDLTYDYRNKVTEEDLKDLSLLSYEDLMGISTKVKGPLYDEVVRELGDRVYYKELDRKISKSDNDGREEP